MAVEFMDTALLIASIVAVISGLIQGYSGFAGALIMVPILASIMNPIDAVAIAMVAGLAGNATITADAAKSAEWRETGSVSVAIAVFIPAGLLFLVSAEPDVIRLGMGIFTLLAAFLLMSGWRYRGSRGLVSGVVVGAVSGLIVGAFGVPSGPVFVVYFLSSQLPVHVQRANIVIAVTVVLTVMVIGLAVEGAYAEETLWRLIVVAPLYLVSTWAGKWLFQKLPSTWFVKVAYVLLLASGVAVLAV
jgi:uncharacterized membrane protein YfcA